MAINLQLLIACSTILMAPSLQYATNTTIEIIPLPPSRHPCFRPCRKDSPPMICRYTFIVEGYEAMSRACYNCPSNSSDCSRPHCVPGDGTRRPLTVINRQLPGPSIEVCLNDEIIVEVQNHLHTEETTIHWHGHHQRGTPYMDGVPLVTQCPITAGSSFGYRFKAVHAGTHFWHSHSGLQRGDGAYGPMIVRVPDEYDSHRSLFDYDLSSHIIMLQDWLKEGSESKFLDHHHSDGDNKPETILVNGRGLMQYSNVTGQIPPPIFEVTKGFRYRFRVINAEFLNCPIEISVDNHNLTIINSDGNNFEPIEVTSVVTYSGERFDFILNANNEIDNYWIRFRGLMDCDERFTSAHQAAILHYAGAKENVYPNGTLDYKSSHNDGMQLNSLNKGTESDNKTISIPEINALDEDDVALKKVPDYQFYVSYDFHKKNNPHFYAESMYEFFPGHKKFILTTPQLNHISMKLLPFPLLSGRDSINPNVFCNETTMTNCENKYCECTHVLQVPLNSVVELILVDIGVTFDANHPFHLHGHTFRVVAMERLGSNTTVEEVKKHDKLGLIKRKLHKAPIKDTVTVPDGGYTVLRFHANNPGYWFFHCHIDFHAAIGMALVFKVGENSDIPPVPKNFPTCGNFMPEDDYLTHTYDEENECAPNTTNSTLFQKIWKHFYSVDDCKPSSATNYHNNYLLVMFTLFFLLIS